MLFSAYPYRIVPQLGAEGLFDEHDGLEGPHIRVAKQMVKPPPYSLPGYAEGLVDVLSVGSFEDHAAWLTRLELHPQVFRLHQPLQSLQEDLVLLGHQISSPISFHRAGRQ